MSFRFHSAISGFNIKNIAKSVAVTALLSGAVALQAAGPGASPQQRERPGADAKTERPDRNGSRQTKAASQGKGKQNNASPGANAAQKKEAAPSGRDKSKPSSPKSSSLDKSKPSPHNPSKSGKHEAGQSIQKAPRSYRDKLDKAGAKLSSKDAAYLADYPVPAGFVVAAIDFGCSDRDLIVSGYNNSVPVNYLKKIARANLKVGMRGAIQMHNNGVPVDLAIAIRDAKLSDKAIEFVRAHNNGVTPQFVRALSKAGYKFSVMDLVRLANNGVSADFAVSRAKGGGNMPGAMDLINARERQHSDKGRRGGGKPGH